MHLIIQVSILISLFLTSSQIRLTPILREICCLAYNKVRKKGSNIYALGVGACARDAVDDDELKYVYHENGKQFVQVLPTFAALFSLGTMSIDNLPPGLKYDPHLLLHGQQYIEIYKPLPSSGRVRPLDDHNS